MEGEKRIGVFTRIYRNEPEMHKAIKSVLNQTYSNFRFYILVNKITKHAISKYAKKDNRIVLIDGKQEDGFKTYAKKIAVENSYLITIDADDWCTPDYLEYLLNEMEKQDLDMIACGNYFVMEDKIIGERKQKQILWRKEATNQVLHYIYGHFRTIWGKLMRAELILNSDFTALPDSTTYGGYGGDTMFIFNLVPNARRLGITDKTLYYYRMSQGSSSHRLLAGRLDSDEITFQYIENILKVVGEYDEPQKRFLFLVYGNALTDTINLVLYTDLSYSDKIKKLLYIFEKNLTNELFFREYGGLLKINGVKMEEFSSKIYNLIFSNIKQTELTTEINQQYLRILEIIYPALNGVLILSEYRILCKNKKILDAFVEGKWQQLFVLLVEDFSIFDEEERKNCIQLMQRLTKDSLLKNILQNDRFILMYSQIILLLVLEKYKEVCLEIKKIFSQEELPDMAEDLVMLWNNLSARLEDVSDFILSKELKIEVSIRLGKLTQAIEEFKELREELNIYDENMIYLENSINTKLSEGE